jgi:phenylalanyl-tRNA synthetase beta chain
MKVPYSWLKEHIPTALSLDAISTTLTLAGLEVDAVTTTRCLFTDVVTAQVIACSSHPESELLKIATIDDGVTQTTVVCKAANCRKGLITAFAKVGATLPHQESTRTITSTTIRGIASDGMLCGLEDLGIESTSDGIVEFDDATALGLPVERLLSDSLFEISLTPNLGHCFSIHGVARELSSFTHEPVVPITGLTTHRFDSGKKYQISLLHDEVMEFHLCLLDAVVIKPSKPLIQNRLKQCGIKPINNVIDALHYAMMEYGQPFHAYDADQLNDSTFSIACTTAPTPFKGLDGIERILPENVLTVFNGSTPVAAAGVIGSFDTMVTPATRRIAIEMASFSPQGVRRGMKKLGMRSEAGAHFEKGLDRKMMMTALSKAIQLIEDSLGTPLQPALQSIVKTPTSHASWP